MVKQLLKFLIVLFVLLAGTTSHSFSNNIHTDVLKATRVHFDKAETQADRNDFLKIHQNLVTAHPFILTQQDKIDSFHESDDETDKTVVLKKVQDFTKYYLCTYCTRAPAHVQQKTLSDLSYYKFPAHYAAVRKYIIFRVIRL